MCDGERVQQLETENAHLREERDEAREAIKYRSDVTTPSQEAEQYQGAIERADRAEAEVARLTEVVESHAAQCDAGEAREKALRDLIRITEKAVRYVLDPSGKGRPYVIDAMALWPKGSNGPIAVAAYESLAERLVTLGKILDAWLTPALSSSPASEEPEVFREVDGGLA